MKEKGIGHKRDRIGVIVKARVRHSEIEATYPDPSQIEWVKFRANTAESSSPHLLPCATWVLRHMLS
jgi:hypothetical protein